MSKSEVGDIKNIDPENWSNLLNVFDELSGLTAEEQALRLSSGQNTATQRSFKNLSEPARCMLEKMLATENEPNILDQTIDPFVENLLGHEAVIQHINPTDILGRSFGPWQVTEELASGGMGQVYKAIRADGQFEKEVALKIIKAGRFSELSQQRFTEEMRTLAQFEHPNIARLIDGGSSDDGIAFFVMELIHGMPITDYVNQHGLSLNERINLVLQATQAVEYAHQNLVIHGDIKPANLLVNESGQIKLVDFGISRPLHDQSTAVILPQFTPCYSSPEQASGKPLGTASDVFGLCAVLYELCSGCPPRTRESFTTHMEYESQQQTPIKKVFQSHQEATLNSEVLPGHDNRAYQNALANELGTIIDKGLMIDVSTRYTNTTELRRDLMLFLEGSAVPSHANNLVYRWRKGWQKNKVLVSISAFAVLGIVTFSVIALNQARIAQEEAEKAQWSSEFLLGVFDQADPVKNQQNPITVNELTQIASDQLLQDEAEFTPAVFTNALSLIGSINYKLGQAESASHIHLKLVKLLQQQASGTEELAQAHFDLGMDYQQLGEFEPALNQFLQASEVIPLEQEITHLGVTAMQSVVMIYTRLNKLEEAQSIINNLLSLEPEIKKYGQARQSMANLYMAKARIDRANSEYTAALNAIENTQSYFKQMSYDPIFHAEILGTVSTIHAAMKNNDLAALADIEAVEIFKKHYGVEHPETMIALSNQASNLGNSGQFGAAIKAYLEVIGMIDNLSLPDFYKPIVYQNLAHQYRKNKQCNEAIEYFNVANGLLAGLETRRVVAEINTSSGLARCYLQLADFSQSETYFNQALELTQLNFGTEHITHANTQLMYVALLMAQKRHSEVAEMMPQIHLTTMKKYGPDSVQVANVYIKWAQLYEQQNNLSKAQEAASEALRIYSMKSFKNQHEKQYQEAMRLSQNM